MLKPMERDNWNRRPEDYNRDRRNRDDRNESGDGYRGAYRLDNDSNHRNETTYDGFDTNRGDAERNRYRGNSYGQRERQEFRGNNDGFSQNRNNRNSLQNDSTSRDDRQFSGRDRDGGYNSGRREQYGSNFNNRYASDNYNHQRGENYGNMAGSLSFGYDGDFNADPDQNRMYDPLSGRRQSYHGHYRTRGAENRDRNNAPSDRNDRYRDQDRY